MEDRAPTEAEFQQFRRWVIRYCTGCAAAVATLAALGTLAEARWVKGLLFFAWTIVFPLLFLVPGVVRLAWGDYAHFLQRYPIELQKEKEREKKRRRAASRMLRDWSIVTKFAVLFFLAFLSALAIWIYVDNEDFEAALVFAGGMALLGVAFLWAFFRPGLTSARPRPE